MYSRFLSKFRPIDFLIIVTKINLISLQIKDVKMKKGTVLLVVFAFVAGILVTVILSNLNKISPNNQQPVSQQATQSIDHQQRIKALEEIVAREPNNRRAWVELGHSYFDSKDPMKAIEAYDKALALDSNDADVLTDQAIMYRQLGWYEKAIEGFKKANNLNPQHTNSLFNMGIVYMQDLGENEKAKEAFQKFLELVPSGPPAESARRMIEHMEGGHN
jgi:tetratricopeptide (TPR) repeat protein